MRVHIRFVVLSSACLAGVSVMPSQARAQIPPCDPSVTPAVVLADLAPSVRVGVQEKFGLEDTTSSADAAGGAVNVRMVGDDGAGGVFFEDTTTERGDRIFFVRVDLGNPPVRIFASYTEVYPGGFACQREVSQTVVGKDKIYFPSKCTNAVSKPRSIIIACGDGGLFLTSLRWRHWTERTTTARGIAHANDCKPYCAAGTFHTYPARVRLSRPALCAKKERFQYRRLTLWFHGQKVSHNFGNCSIEY